MRALAALLLVTLLLATPLASATHARWDGSAVGRYVFAKGIAGNCMAPTVVRISHPTELGAWRIEAWRLPGYDIFRAFGVQQLECALPEFRRWDDVQGSPAGGWSRDVTTGCEREVLSVGPTAPIGLVSFSLSRAGCGPSSLWTANLAGA